MTIVASDLEVTMMSNISVESNSEGRITIPARILTDTLKTFSEEPLTFIIDLESYLMKLFNWVIINYLDRMLMNFLKHQNPLHPQ